MSHQSNSHTLAPSIVHGPEYTEFESLNGNYLVDFAGMFDSKGPELDTILDLGL